MLSLRKIVAGPKIRTIENGYNLDLSYVTTRVIAMAFPAEGFQKLYRNSIDDVSKYLKEKHPEKFMLYNLSGRKYDYKKFDGNVRDFDWEDHQAPVLPTIFQICHHMYNHLKQNQENVVVVHCNQGKGRTGTIIVCLLLYCSFFDTPNWAIQFYAKRRFQKMGYGVTQPCQLRYIHYFHYLLVKKSIQIKAYSIKKIEFKGKFKVDNCYCIVSTTKNKIKILKTDILKNGVFNIKQKNLILGDIFLDFRIPGIFGIGDKQFARINLNSIFIPKDLIISLAIQDISPDNFQTKFKGMINEDFKIEITFQEYCQCDLTSSNQLNHCPCINQIRSERGDWQKMYNILNEYNQPTKQQSVALLFGQDTYASHKEKSQQKTKSNYSQQNSNKNSI